MFPGPMQTGDDCVLGKVPRSQTGDDCVLGKVPSSKKGDDCVLGKMYSGLHSYRRQLVVRIRHMPEEKKCRVVGR